jgi:hypothetical protein
MSTVLSEAQIALLQKHGGTEQGLTTDQASARREEVGSFNTVDPPIQCPAWICCLLPCIKHIASMKVYRQIKPDDAEVKRDGRWIRYDSSSLVPGDLIRMEEGDVVPADCVVLKLEDDCSELLVDHRYVTGEESPRSAKQNDDHHGFQLYWGGRVVLGSAIAVVTDTGSNTLVAKLIREKRFPPTGIVLLPSSPGDDVDEEAGIFLVRQNSKSEIS